MIKKIRVTVDGKPYEVTVEVPDETPTPAPGAPAQTEPPPGAPLPPPAPTPAAAPPAAPAPAATSATGPGGVQSPLAGFVIAVAVSVGQQVKKEDNLVTIEAMKMNTFVLAPSDGKVLAVKVKVGDAVSEGQILVEIG
jgi:biotin carboxyl carrier protein